MTLVIKKRIIFRITQYPILMTLTRAMTGCQGKLNSFQVELFITYIFISHKPGRTHVGKNGMTWSSNVPKDREPCGIFDDSKIGPAEHMRSLKSAAQAFKAFLSEAIIEEVVCCTNLYRERYYTGKYQVWKPVSINEMWAFIGILIVAGRNHQNYMSEDHIK